MFGAGIAMEAVMKLFSNGTTSQNLREHTNGRTKLTPLDCSGY